VQCIPYMCTVYQGAYPVLRAPLVLVRGAACAMCVGVVEVPPVVVVHDSHSNIVLSLGVIIAAAGPSFLRTINTTRLHCNLVLGSARFTNSFPWIYQSIGCTVQRPHWQHVLWCGHRQGCLIPTCGANAEGHRLGCN